MARFQLLTLIGITVLLFSCQEASTQTQKSVTESTKKSSPKVNYNFPYNTIIDKLQQGCFEDPADWLLMAGAEAEELALNTFFPITEDMEIEAGQSIHKDFDYSFIEDARTQKLRSILDKMRPFISRGLEYKIFLIEDEVINAWTIPGGYIYVTTGILDFIENDDELANVIGHEIGHNENKHTTKIIQRNAPRHIHPDIGVMVDVYSLATMAYNQPQELEADQSGFYLAYKAGYNPRRGLEFWKRLAEFENPNFLEKLFRSHPYSASRYQCGQEYLDQAKLD